MKNLVTKRYRGYTYHVEANGDYYIACKTQKGFYIGFPASHDYKIPIEQLINKELSENIFFKTSKNQLLRDAEARAKEVLC